MAGEYFIVDLRPEWLGNPYITLWRPDNAGYCYSLPWAGRYDEDVINEAGDYYHGSKDHRSRIDRFPVPCAVVEALATASPGPELVDGNVGPVIPNTPGIRARLKRAKYRPAGRSLAPTM
jgi:hypothetical protein